MEPEKFFYHDGGFYSSAIHDVIPLEAVEITDDQRMALIEGQAAGRLITVDDSGMPVLVDPPTPSIDELKSQAIRSVTAYATRVRTQLVGDADPYKVAGWSDKHQRARRVVAQTNTVHDLEIVQTEATRRGKGETPLDLAQKQVEKAQALANALAVTDGLESAAVTAVQAQSNASDLATLLTELETQAEMTLTQLTPLTGEPYV